MRILLRFIGRLVAGLAISIPLLLLAGLSAIPYGGGSRVMFFVAWLPTVASFLWAVIGLAEPESHQALPAPPNAIPRQLAPQVWRCPACRAENPGAATLCPFCGWPEQRNPT